jgi:hypothetical protein
MSSACVKCANPLKPTAGFCTRCGTKVAVAPVVAPAPLGGSVNSITAFAKTPAVEPAGFFFFFFLVFFLLLDKIWPQTAKVLIASSVLQN